MTIGVTLNDKHCFDDYKMWLTDVDITQPEVQTHYVQVPGRNGELDLTEALTGDVRFYNGSMSLTFQTAEKVCGRSWFDQLELIREALHGQRATIVFDGSAVEYSGRCEVSGTPVAGGIYEIQVDVTVDGSETLSAFTFYSATDNSLNFYCGHIPSAGGTYKGKTVTTVYTDFINVGVIDPLWYGISQMCKSVLIDKSFAGCKPTSCYQWFYDFANCTAIDGLKYLDTSAATDISGMFHTCASLTTLDVSNFDTSAVTTMYTMFCKCSSLTTLNVSNFDTSSVTHMNSMFYGCSALTTIYSDDSKFVTTKVTSDTNMFASCTKLVGGNGTAYDSSKVTHTMAHVDTASNPGYFTKR